MVNFKKFSRYINKSKDYSKFENYIFLEQNYWDDYGFETTFESYLVRNNKLLFLGSLNIGNLHFEKKDYSGFSKYKTFDDTDFSEEFTRIHSNFVSLGNERFYISLHKYFNLKECHDILFQINDLTVLTDTSSLVDYLNEEIVSTSFFRGYDLTESEEYIKYSLGPVAKEGRRSGYDITYSYLDSENKEISKIKFISDPEQIFPQNVHAIIGNNGVGKTRFFKDIVLLAARQQMRAESQFQCNGEKLKIQFSSDDELKIDSPSDYFSKILFISFSPFDNLTLTNGRPLGKQNANLNYIGLYQNGKTPIGLETMKNDYLKNLEKIFQNKDNYSLLNQILLEKSFINYQDYVELKSEKNIEEQKNIIKLLFDRSSSGQKIVLLSTVSLIAETQKYSLVLIDEPELFLHPPLISNFIRTISEIMKIKNGLCIVSTHSPIILQEIPKDCVKIMKNEQSGFFAMYEPEFETFGENLSTLTNNIFELDQYNSGFYTLIEKLINNPEEYDLTIEDIKELKFGRDGNLFKELLLYKKSGE